jgi:hypothetical protein
MLSTKQWKKEMAFHKSLFPILCHLKMSSLTSLHFKDDCDKFPFPFHFSSHFFLNGRLCDLVVRVPGYRSRGLGSIPGATRFSEKQWVWNRVH